MRCVCGHSDAAHEHYRAGTECAICLCPRFVAPIGTALWAWLVGWWHRRGWR